MWLRDAICQFLPGVIIPPVHQKRVKENIDEEKKIKRQMLLNHFMDAIIRHPLIRRTPFLQEFLQESDPKRFVNLRKQVSKIKKPENVNQFVSLNGKLQCSNLSQKFTLNRMNEYITMSEGLKKKLKRQGELVMEDLNKLSESLNGYSDLFKQLSAYQEFLPFNTGNKNLYSDVHQALSIWANHEQEKIGIMNQYFSMHFKFLYKELNTLKDLLKEQEQLEINYRRSTTKRNLNTENLKNIYAYYTNQCIEEGERIILDNALLSNLHFWEMARHQADDTIQYHLIWGNLMSKLIEARHENIPERPYIHFKK